ncbi:MAG: hypothetical protein ACHQT7_01825 [Candidatus Levyibacteriota bacterium]
MTEAVLHRREVKSSGGVERALITQVDPDFKNIEKLPELVSRLSDVGLTPEDLRTLIQGDFKDI